MKVHPVLDLSPEIRDTNRGKDFLHALRKNVDEDDGGRQMWSQKLDHYRRRRYAMEYRDPTYPWPGSSSIVMPLIDKKIDEMKPLYLNLLMAAKPPVTVLGQNKDSLEKARSLELWFEWLIKFGSPRFMEEYIFCIDDALEQGFGILKSMLIYETRNTATFLRASKLPDRLRALIVTQNKNADELAMLSGLPVITKDEFDSPQIRPALKIAIREEFDLDEDEPKDQKAFQQIFSWLRSGAKGDLKYEHRDVIYNVPGVVAVRPQDLLVPENAPNDPEGCERLTHSMVFNRVQLEAKARDGEWNKEAVEEILRAKKGRNSTGRRFTLSEVDEAIREGVSSAESNDQYQVFETCCYWSPGEGKPAEKAVVLWAPDSTSIPLKFVKYQRPSGKWPFHRVDFELNKNRWHSSRGIPEKIDDLEFEITMQHRYKLNRATIATAPTIFFDPASGFNPSSFHHIPGQCVPVRRPESVKVMEWSQLDPIFEREEQVLRTWVEEHIGGVDHGLSNPLSSLGEARTATEMNMINRKSQQSLTLRGVLAQRMLNGVWREMFDLQMAYGDDEVLVQVSGMPEALKLTKEELQGQYIFQSTGTMGELDPATEAQKSLMRIQLLSNPEVRAMLEPQYEIDMGALVADWLERDDVRVAKKVLRKRTPQEVQLIAQKMQEQQSQQLLAQMPPPGGGSGKPSSSSQAGPAKPQRQPQTNGAAK